MSKQMICAGAWDEGYMNMRENKPSEGSEGEGSEGEYLEELKEEFVSLMRRLHREQFYPVAFPEGLSRAEMHSLLYVWRSKKIGRDCRPSELAKASSISASAISQTLKRLEELGFVTRVRSVSDSRSVIIELTAKGQEVITQIFQRRSDYFDGMFSFVGIEDMKTLMRIMNQVLEYTHQQHENEKGAPACE